MYFRLAVALVLASSVAVAGDARKMDIKVIVDDTNDVYEFSSDDLQFDMFSMQVGENRAFVDQQGRNGLITRSESGFTLEVAGKTIDLPTPSAMHDMHNLVDLADVDVDVMHEMAFVGEQGGNVVVTEKAVDEATRQSIESLLESAGHKGGVEFIDSASIESQIIKNVKVIKKEAL